MIGEFVRTVFYGRTVKEYGSFGGGAGGFFGWTKKAYLVESGDRRKLILSARSGTQFQSLSLERSDVKNLIEVLTDAREQM